MHKTTTPRRKTFRRYAIASTALLATGAMGALMAGVTPATAANLATQPDTQIAVFMVPLTILVLAMLFEAARFALRGPMPAKAPLRQPAPRPWSSTSKRR
jgi:asparagine N-glycosylation enzyme membrane subunit Stt3